MKKIIITIIILLLLLIASYFLIISTNKTTGSTVSSDSFKTFSISGENYKFLIDGRISPEIRVKEGDRVKINFKSTSGFHDFVIDEFNVKTNQVKPENGMTSAEFIADTKGTFEYYCSIGQHRANGMKGKLIVE